MSPSDGRCQGLPYGVDCATDQGTQSTIYLAQYDSLGGSSSSLGLLRYRGPTGGTIASRPARSQPSDSPLGSIALLPVFPTRRSPDGRFIGRDQSPERERGKIMETKHERGSWAVVHRVYPECPFNFDERMNKEHSGRRFANAINNQANSVLDIGTSIRCDWAEEEMESAFPREVPRGLAAEREWRSGVRTSSRRLALVSARPSHRAFKLRTFRIQVSAPSIRQIAEPTHGNAAMRNTRQSCLDWMLLD
ncbi:predicted protein [Uncinocarpus reesii 1704]|uniref:Uncharacterized protein n=1 Tax=Uncinocarpus reesii (strain UAMH 1704) TaxID=336963 RepID=C4JXC5_UNCRE|nr:uncharacterized protein UREG_06298 [Uncinocarpus reesii 1704]EEP81433.1 predicted protein [Uncinocarpus reesii 1704]